MLDRSFWKAHPSLKVVKQKVAEGHSPTAMTSAHFDATVYAILEDQPLEIVKYLMAQGNEVNKLTHDARTYLFWAAYAGNLELMQYLMVSGADPNVIDQHGYTVLMFAASTAQEEHAIYDYLLDIGFDITKEKDRTGRNALLAYAGKTQSGDLIPYFIKKGLDIQSTDKKGNGLFHHAAKTGNKALLEKLISNEGVDISANAETGENAVLFASRRLVRNDKETDVAFYQYLEGLGLDPLVVDIDGNTALHHLSRRSKSEELFSYFLEKGVDPNLVNNDGNNALIIASATKSLPIIKQLTHKTHNINAVNKKGFSAFAQAMKYNTLEVARYLANEGAKTHVVDEAGFDVGYHLVDAYNGDMKDFSDKINYLISLGYDPRSKQKNGATLLHAAIKKNDSALLEQLIGLGIDINAKDGEGHTALHHAAMQSPDDKVLRYLVEAGADIHATTEFDESVYDLANGNELLQHNNTNIEFLKTSRR